MREIAKLSVKNKNGKNVIDSGEGRVFYFTIFIRVGDVVCK
jgi:hypothetical protein